jgi:hypothetical protein
MTYEAAVLGDSPTLLWMLAETTGTTAADATGNGNDGTYTDTGVTLAQPGPPGVSAAAAEFDGSAGFAYSNSDIYSPSTAGEIWFSSSSADGGTIMSGNAWIVALGDDGRITYLVYDGENLNTCQSAATFGDGGWHYIVATYDSGTTAMTLYADGAQVAEGTSATMANSPGSPVYSAGYEDQDVSSSPLLAGTVSAYAVYPAALTADQVTAHYDAAVGAPPSSPSGLLMSGIV